MRTKLRHPIRAIREPFGTAGLIVACVALIAALGGSAIAANNALTSKQKKEVKKIAKQFAGQDGAQGPAGQAGPQGPKGDTGAPGSAGANGKDGTNGTNGTNGEDGEDGESVTITDLDPGNGQGHCEDSGGAAFTNGTGTAFACSGSGDSVGYPQTLPPGRTMTGTWEILGDGSFQLSAGPEFNYAVTSIGYPLALASAPTDTVLIKSASSEADKDKCPGNGENPEATAGILCLYLKFFNPSVGEPTLLFDQVSKADAGLAFAEDDEAIGSWAVTAP